jgi:hypothetical protein
MPSETEIVIAFTFKRSGKAELDFSEMYLTLSMGLKWFTPDDAKKFVNNALKQKLLLKKDGALRPGFEIDKINVPLGFHPAGIPIDKEEKEPIKLSILDEIMEEIAAVAKIKKEEIYEKIKKIEQEKNINSNVAALMVGKEFDINLEKFYEKIEKEFN